RQGSKTDSRASASGSHRSFVYEVRSARGDALMPLHLREFHPFEAAGRRFVYLVPSAAVFALDDTASAVVDALGRGPRTRGQLVDELSNRFERSQLEETVSELLAARAIGETTR